MPHRIALISEDGARPELTQATVHVPETTDGQFEGGDPVPGQLSQLDKQGRISEDFDFPLSTISGPPDRPCAETHSRERQ